jgi:translation initiation factor 3 subunit G
MSTARFGRKWADVDEDDEENDLIDSPNSKSKATRFESLPDENGIKTVIEYTERDKKTYKITRKIRTKTVVNRTNKNITERKSMEKFGKASQNEAAAEKQLVVRSEEDINIELSKKLQTQASVQDEAVEKFYEESIQITDNLNKEKKAWAQMNAERQRDRDEVGVAASPEGEKAAAGTKVEETKPEDPNKKTSTYVPPSLRNDKGKGTGKGGMGDGQEASLRITNLSEDVREGDLHDLFGHYGRLQRVYLAKDMTTGTSRGFAFVTYCNRDDAQKAIDKLNGYGYDNLILQVQFAKPRA